MAIGLALPGVEEGTSYGQPALRFRGKTLAGTTAPDSDSFVLHVSLAEKEVLLDTDPATFWQTDHYRDWPAVLVRYGTPVTDRIALLLERAWWDRATLTQRRGRGERP
nr:MmcQ/YjbR family DNA-binding protein [Sphingomonas hankookensis]